MKTRRARWCEDILQVVAAEPLRAVHEFRRADGTLAYVTATYASGPGGRVITGVPFVPATSQGGGWWNASPLGARALAIPEADRPFAPDEPHPIYGLPVLLAQPADRQVWIVIGEDAADAVNALTLRNPDTGAERRAPPAISVRHGYQAGGADDPFSMLDLEPLRGRQVAVLAEPEEASHDLARATARTLSLRCACEVRIMLPEVPGPGQEYADIAAVAEAGGLPAIGRWVQRHGITDYELWPYERPPPLPSSMDETEHFKVLGIAGGLLAVRRKSTQEVHLLRRTAITQEAALLQLAPLQWWNAQCGGSPFSSVWRTVFGDALIRAGEAAGPVSLSLDSAGRGAHDHDGVIRYNLGDRLLTTDDQRLLTLEAALDSADFLYHPGPALDLRDDARAEQWAREFYEAMGAYRQLAPNAHRVVMGWCVTSLIGGCLPVRPHLWLIAPGRDSRTFVTDTLLGRFFGPAARSLSLRGQAALSSVALADSLPATIDGFGAATRRRSAARWERVLKLLRSAGGAAADSTGRRLHADAQPGAASTVRARFSAFVADADRPTLHEADEDGFVMVRLSPVPMPGRPDVERAVLAATDPSKMLAVRTRIIRHAAIIRDKALAAEHAVRTDRPGIKTRHAQLIGALTAGAWFLSGDDEPVARDVTVGEDAWVPLAALMTRKLKRPGRDDLTLAEYLHRAYFTQGRFEDPDPRGAWTETDLDAPAAFRALCLQRGFLFAAEDELWVATRLPAFRELMRGTKYSGFDWTRYLTDLPGGFRPRDPKTGRIARRTFGGEKQNVVAIGREALEVVGLGLFVERAEP